MCRWHKHAVKQAATDPVTGEFDLGKYALGLTAMALFRIEQKQWQMPELFEIDGFNPEELLTDDAKAAFARSGLERPLDDVKASLDANIEKIRAALNATAARCDLTKEALNITDNVTQDGYKKTCCAPPDPRENGPFLDAAVVNLFKGYDDNQRSYASGDLELIDADELLALVNDDTVAEHDRTCIALLEAIRNATEIFLKEPGIRDVLEETFKDSVAYICQTAQDDFDHGRGLSGPSNCIMCEGAKGRKDQQEPEAPQQKTQENNRSSLRETFTNCCKCARDGVGGAVLSHVGCIAGPAIAGLFGGSLSHTFMAAAMYVTSPLIAMGATWGLARLRGQKSSVPKLMGSAAIALVVAFGINQFIGHDHEGGHESGHDHEHHQHHHHNHHHHEGVGKILENEVICGPSYCP